MSRTDLSATDLAKSLRAKAGDGSVEWCYEPMQVSVLLDMADMLDESARLREVVADGEMHAHEILAENDRLRKITSDLYALVVSEGVYVRYPYLDEFDKKLSAIEVLMKELGIEVDW